MGVMCITLRLDKILFNHFNSQVVIAIERHLASTDDLDTICCFFVFQEIRESPRNIIQPVSDLQVSGQPSQSHRTIHVDVGHIYYATRYLVPDSVSDNKQLAMLRANDPPLVVA